jgi:hypothetical protein
MKQALIDELWDWAQPMGRVLQRRDLSELPVAVRRYLEHAIAPGAPIASAVRLRMHGEIKLRDWQSFAAEQVIAWPRGMVWDATVRMNGLAVRGFDRFIDGQGAMRWRLFGIIPIISASGPDITRSATGRVLAEMVWLPSILCTEEAAWAQENESRPRVRLAAGDEAADVTLTIDAQGRVRYAPCSAGAILEAARSDTSRSAPSSRMNVGLLITRYRRAYAWGGTLEPTDLSPRASSSGPSWMTRYTAEEPDAPFRLRRYATRTKLSPRSTKSPSAYANCA